jgi:hypothetical protein
MLLHYYISLYIIIILTHDIILLYSHVSKLLYHYIIILVMLVMGLAAHSHDTQSASCVSWLWGGGP